MSTLSRKVAHPLKRDRPGDRLSIPLASNMMTASSFTVGSSEEVKRPRLTAGITSAEFGERPAKFSTRDAVRLLEEALKSWDAGDRQ
uniref:Transposase n=1 Tax=Ascaris lumbricoides TaxID=6252 RepID=A0A0M3IV58_ASCLU